MIELIDPGGMALHSDQLCVQRISDSFFTHAVLFIVCALPDKKLSELHLLILTPTGTLGWVWDYLGEENDESRFRLLNR